MPIQVLWGNPDKTVLLEIIEGNWSLSDVYDVLDEVDALLATVPHHVDIIVNLTNSHFFMGNLLSVVGRAERNQPSNIGLLITVNASSYIKTIAGIAGRLAPKLTHKMRFVDSIEAAYEVLEAQKSSVA